jgi:hypothetical protein
MARFDPKIWTRQRYFLPAVLTLAIVGAAAAAYIYHQSLTPGNILQAALVKTFGSDGVKSARFAGTLDMQDPQMPSAIQAVTVSGAMNEMGAMELRLGTTVEQTPVTADIIMADSNYLYAKLSGVKNGSAILKAIGQNERFAGQEATVDQIGQSIDGQWYELDSELFDGLGEETQFGTVLEGVSQEDINKLRKLFKNHPFLEASDKLADEQIDGADTYHLVAQVNREVLKEFITAGRREGLKNLQMGDEEFQQMLQRLDATDFSKHPVDVWIEKSSRYIKQVAYAWSDNGASGKVRLTLTDINQPVTVKAPEQKKTIIELISQIMPLLQPLLNQTTPAAP